LPVEFATAAISIPDLVPSMNELNICGFIPPSAARSGVIPKCSHTVSGVERWKLGKYLVPLPAATTAKPEARAQSTISAISAGWSPQASV